MLDELNTSHLQMSSWTQGRLAEMRRTADMEAMLRAARQGRNASWAKRLARQLGSVMVTWGAWLESQAGIPARAER